MMRRTIAAAVLAVLCMCSVAWATTTTKNLKLTSGFTEGQSGWGNAMNANLNAIDAASPMTVTTMTGAAIQAAIDSLGASGGEIHLVAGTYALSAPLVLDKAVKLYGSGQYSTALEMDNPDSNIANITASSASLRDLCLTVALADTGAGGGIGVRIIASSASISDVSLDHVRIQHTGSWGVKVCGQYASEAPDISAYDIVSPVFHAVTVYNCRSGGAVFSGMGVSTPIFDECNFVARGYGAGGFWTGNPFYASGTTEMARGEVYIFGSTATVFRNCFFQLDGSATDSPMLTMEDTHTTRLESCYFEVGAASPRTNWMVTMGHARGFSIRDTYVYSPADAPLHFLHTNSDGASQCTGVIDGFYALQADSALTDDVDDFVFNSTGGDASGRGAITLSNIHIYNTVGRPERDPSVTHETGGGRTAGFPLQNVLLMGAGRRIRVPVTSADSISTIGDLKPGELVYGRAGTGLSGGLGKLLMVGQHAALAPIPIIPQGADTAAVRAYYVSAASIPREGDLCYTTGDHKLKVYTGSVWEVLN